MSSIIKGGRIRNQSIIDFAQRCSSDLESDLELKEINSEEISSNEETSYDEMLAFKQKQLQDIEQMINEKLEEANKKAGQIVSEALEQAKHIESEAQIRKNEMLFEMNEEKERVLECANDKAKEIEAEAYGEKKRILANTEQEITETMVILLQHIISEELNYHTDWVRCLVKRMLSDDHINDGVKVVLAPKLFERLSEEEKDAITQLKKQTTIEVDDTLNETMCKVETSLGNISYDVAEGLERVVSDIRILQNVK